MAYVAKPHGAFVTMGIIFLLIGFYSFSKSFEPPPIPNCEGAQNYFISNELPEVTVDLKPDCWSGTFNSDNGLSWDALESDKPYEALYSDSYVYKGNNTVGQKAEIVRHPLPMRFRGTGKMKVTAYRVR
jgi:hypothetical protein